MIKPTIIAATALFAATFLMQPQAEAAPAAAFKPSVETSQVQLVHSRDRDRDRRWDRRRDRYERGRHQRGGWHHGPHRRGHLVRTYHPRYGWVWVEVSRRGHSVHWR
ncbi:hypothetical protein [Lutibaculum baratangense]|nr:hypothetical protein [Lutibaculum baratangense]